jgi:cation transport protein ChaC
MSAVPASYARPMAREPHRLSAAELAASLEHTLAGWDHRSPIWLFAYGSLIWKPELDYEWRVPARVHGYHRKLCLRSVTYRGTLDCPGLVCGLDRGGSCVGMAYRVAPAAVHSQFERLWQREMTLNSYAPRWLDVRRMDRPRHVRALAFVVRRDAPNYCGRLPEADVIDILVRACGRYGTSLDYLQRTVASLSAAGLRDPHLERLAHRAARLAHG